MLFHTTTDKLSRPCDRFGRIGMEEGKIVAIRDWRISKPVTKLCSFFRLANYYMQFVEGFSKRASSLAELLKSDIQWGFNP